MLDISGLIPNVDSQYNYAEFSFAKGRKSIKETELVCAEREFLEETHYDNSTYQFIKNYPTIEETFIGTNGVTYTHVYYLVKMRKGVTNSPININNDSGEVQNIGWFSFEECSKLIRPYDTEKKKILKNVYDDIVKMNHIYECCDDYMMN